MEASDAPSSTNPSPRTAADPPPDEPTLQLPSEAPTSAATTTPSSVSLSSPSPSSAASPSQPQSQSSMHQRQPVASRTRSQTQLGQSAFTQSTSSSASSSAPLIQRNGLAIGVPAILPNHARPPPSLGYSYGSSSHFSQPLMSSSSPSPSFSQPLGGFPRGSVPLAEQSAGSIAPSPSFSQPFSAMPRSSSGIPDQQPSSNSQFKPPIPSVQTIGMIGSLSGASRMRASGIQHQQRLGQPTDKSLPQSATNQTLNTPKFPNPGLSRPTSMPLPNVPISAPQSAQSLQQQWMSNQGKQTHGASFPSTAYRPHTKQQYSPPVAPNLPQVLPSQQQQQQQQQKQHQQQLQQHHHQQQQNISTHHLQDLHSNRNQQSLPQQHQQAPKGHASITQRSNNQLGQPDLGHSGSAISVTEDTPETGDQILSKRSIQELVAQIDPYEKLEPEVEDVLVEIADDFVESITTAACLLAKHRRSTALEAKDILLYVERNWNMTLPGFGGDDIKLYKKPYTTDIHKERLAMIRKSAGIASDMGTAKNVAAGQVAASSKAQAIKASAPSFTSPKGS
ncbi:hypothetical protein M5K25_023883 [Dendrobium thyrsiflorum]|uniref:Transcription initiation factor TFIID subunit 12 domain-containing protein n=1 Tax=Dendrobium thyrsiflorum TaxID=117978 RepID=A0ABD0U0M4_DENTH